MRRWEVLRQAQRRELSSRNGLKLQRLLNLLGVQKSISTLSKALSDEKPTRIAQEIEKKLEDKSVRDLVAQALRHETFEQLAEATATPTPPADGNDPMVDVIHAQTESDPHGWGISAYEKKTIALLRTALNRQSRTDLKVWDVDVWSGGSFIARNLAYGIKDGDPIKQVIILRSTDLVRPYQNELKDLAERFGLDPALKKFPTQFIEYLYNHGILLVFLGAELIPRGKLGPKGPHPVGSLISQARYESRYPNKRSVILFVGRASSFGSQSILLDEEIQNAMRLSRRGKSGKKGKGKDKNRAYPVFVDQLARFSALRGHSNTFEGGSRHKRGRWHYHTITNKAKKLESDEADSLDEDSNFRIGQSERPIVWPINVRLRAFFASNHDNYAYVDPTAGFEQLAGSIDIPQDIQDYVDDIQTYLATIDLTSRHRRTKYKTQRKMLRLLSTGKYWVTQEMLNILCEASPRQGSWPGFHEITPDSQIARLRELGEVIVTRYITQQPFNAAAQEAYAVGIGVKALIQDEWRKSDRAERSVIHHRVAKRLHESRDNKALLASEFPYEPHWGRSRIYFLAETIRHLVRSCEGVLEGDFPKPDSNANDKRRNLDDLPLAPDPEIKGCNPYEVWPYCFETLFQRELNGNRSKANSRSLSKRHGSYQLSLELLQLLSLNNEIGEPHWALPEGLHNRFRKEAAFSLLDVGELSKAEALFTRVLETSRNDPPARAIDNKLSLALVKTLKGELDKASELLSECELQYASFAQSDGAKGKKPHLSRTSLLKRMEDRQALIDHHQGHHLTVIASYSEPDKYRNLKGDVAHCFILSVRKSTPDDWFMNPDADHTFLTRYEMAMEVCMKNLTAASGEGKNHEAMGFQIALAGLMSDGFYLHNAAERTLEGVQSDLLRFGASERTLLHFLIEAGKTLSKKQQYRRAFASYLYPAYRRAAEKEHKQEALDALSAARSALNELIEKQSLLSLNDIRKDIKAAVEYANRQRANDSPKRQDGAALDPLYAYQTVESERIIRSTESEENLKNYVREIDEIEERW